MEQDDEAVSLTPPRYSLVRTWKTIRKKGIIRALEDTEQGPHVHLTLLLITVVIVSLVIIVISKIVQG